MEAEFLLDAWVTLVLSYLLGCCSIESLEETALLDLENWRCRVSPRRQGSPSVELLIDSAVSLLLNLGAARQGRSVLFSDEQKLRFKGWRAEELLLKHEDDKLVLIVLLFWLRISTFMEFSPLR
jgi:hypothetical protein